MFNLFLIRSIPLLSRSDKFTYAFVHSIQPAVITTSGRSAHLVSKYKPKCPIIAVTRFPQTARQCHLYRGILPLCYNGTYSLLFQQRHACNSIGFHWFSVVEPAQNDWMKDVDDRVQFGVRFGKARGFIKTGDPIIVVTGWKQGSGFTNTMRIVLVLQFHLDLQWKQKSKKIFNSFLLFSFNFQHCRVKMR